MWRDRLARIWTLCIYALGAAAHVVILDLALEFDFLVLAQSTDPSIRSFNIFSQSIVLTVKRSL